MRLLVSNELLACSEISSRYIILEDLRLVLVVHLLPRYDWTHEFVTRQYHILGFRIGLQLCCSDVALIFVLRGRIFLFILFTQMLHLFGVCCIDLLVVINYFLDSPRCIPV